jgi:DNA-binding NarL/FixJ family response regulator
LRVGIVASDPTVARGLERLFARRGGVELVAAAARPRDGDEGASGDGAAPEAPLDLLIIDVWPPSARAAEALCLHWRARQPLAAIVAVVHHLTPALRARMARAGCTALWPKDGVRELPAFAAELVGAGRSVP